MDPSICQVTLNNVTDTDWAQVPRTHTMPDHMTDERENASLHGNSVAKQLDEVLQPEGLAKSISGKWTSSDSLAEYSCSMNHISYI